MTDESEMRPYFNGDVIFHAVVRVVNAPAVMSPGFTRPWALFMSVIRLRQCTARPRVKSPGLRVPDSNAGRGGRYDVPRCSCERRPCSLRWRVRFSLRLPLPESLPTRGLHR